jgi:hypothetical protein
LPDSLALFKSLRDEKLRRLSFAAGAHRP